MSASEHALTFACKQEQLVGVISMPAIDQAPQHTGVVVIVGGPQYRAGSHRQFVLLARAIASAGYPVLRFDYRGMGDSAGTQRDFSATGADVAAAIDAMQEYVPDVRQIVLWGLCDGASAALLYCHETNDTRVTGMCLLNPWVRSEVSLARAHVKHYYVDRLKQKEFWFRLLSGKVAGAALAGLWRNISLAASGASAKASDQTQPFQNRMAQAWGIFTGRILLLLSGNDYTAKEFLEFTSADAAWAGLLGQANVLRHDLAEADHTFSEAGARTRVESLTLAWLPTCTAP